MTAQIHKLRLSWGANHRLHLRRKLLEDQETRLLINNALEQNWSITTNGKIWTIKHRSFWIAPYTEDM